MEEIFQAFGVDVKLIIIQIFNFGLLLLALWYFLYTPILSLLENRREKIKKGMRDAEAAEEALQGAKNSKNEIVGEAHKEAEHIVKHAEEHAGHRETVILAEAALRAETLVKNAEKQGEDLKEKMRKEAEADVAKAAILAAEKVLREGELEKQ